MTIYLKFFIKWNFAVYHVDCIENTVSLKCDVQAAADKGDWRDREESQEAEAAAHLVG